MRDLKAFFVSCLLCISASAKSIPDPSDTAHMARYIINNVDWITIATISTLPVIKTYPFANLKSVSDGPVGKGTGKVYLLMTNLDLSGKDVRKDNRVTVMATLAEVDYCKRKNYDPQDPRCGRLLISGKLVKIDETTEEYNLAKDYLFIRHPDMKDWMDVHSFYIAKVDIENILILDNFGGAKTVKVDDYYNANDYSAIKPITSNYDDVLVVQMGYFKSYRAH